MEVSQRVDREINDLIVFNLHINMQIKWIYMN